MKRLTICMALLSSTCLAQTIPSPTPTGPNGLFNPADIFIPMGGKVDTADGMMTGAKIGAAHIQVAGDENLSVLPTGNEYPTLSSASIQGTAQVNNAREFLVNIGFTSNNGTGLAGAQTGRVALYSGMNCLAGSTDCWSTNLLVGLTPGFTGNAQGAEYDINNFAYDSNVLTGSKLVTGVTVTGATGTGTFLSAYAFGTITAGSAAFHNGYVVLNGSVADNAFHDLGNSTVSLKIDGTHLYGLDFAGMVGGTVAVRLGNSQAVVARNGANNADVVLLQTDSSNSLYLGGGATSIALGSPIQGNVNYFLAQAAGVTGLSPSLSAVGSDANVSMTLGTKSAGCLVGRSSTAGQFLSACPVGGLSTSTATFTSVPTTDPHAAGQLWKSGTQLMISNG